MGEKNNNVKNVEMEKVLNRDVMSKFDDLVEQGVSEDGTEYYAFHRRRTMLKALREDFPDARLEIGHPENLKDSVNKFSVGVAIYLSREDQIDELPAVTVFAESDATGDSGASPFNAVTTKAVRSALELLGYGPSIETLAEFSETVINEDLDEKVAANVVVKAEKADPSIKRQAVILEEEAETEKETVEVKKEVKAKAKPAKKEVVETEEEVAEESFVGTLEGLSKEMPINNLKNNVDKKAEEAAVQTTLEIEESIEEEAKDVEEVVAEVVEETIDETIDEVEAKKVEEPVVETEEPVVETKEESSTEGISEELLDLLAKDPKGYDAKNFKNYIQELKDEGIIDHNIKTLITNKNNEYIPRDKEEALSVITFRQLAKAGFEDIREFLSYDITEALDLITGDGPLEDVVKEKAKLGEYKRHVLYLIWLLNSIERQPSLVDNNPLDSQVAILLYHEIQDANEALSELEEEITTALQ